MAQKKIEAAIQQLEKVKMFPTAAALKKKLAEASRTKH